MSVRLPDPFIVEGAPGFTTGDLMSNHPIIQDPLTDGRVLQVDNGNQYWSIDITYPDLFPEEYSLVISAIERAKATKDFIDILLPQYMHYRVVGDVGAAVIPAGQKSNTLRVTNVGQLGGIPLAGDLVQLLGSASRKVYRITYVDTDVAGQWTLGIYPDLQAQTTGVEKPEFNNILFQTKMTDWNHKSSINVDGMYTGVGFTFREAK